MDKNVVEKKLAELMDIVPECEGLIAADTKGKVIVGQTIHESDHGAIAMICADIVKAATGLGDHIDKGSIKDTTIELDNGFAIIVGTTDIILVALAGTDGRSSLGLLKRKLMDIVKL